MPFEQIVLLLKRAPVDVDEVIQEADRHEAIDDRLLARLAHEASERTNVENLL